MFKKIFLSALLVTSVAAFNGQAPAAFTQKYSSESALKMAGGSTAPALKVCYIDIDIDIVLQLILLYYLFFESIIHHTSMIC